MLKMEFSQMMPELMMSLDAQMTTLVGTIPVRATQLLISEINNIRWKIRTGYHKIFCDFLRQT